MAAQQEWIDDVRRWCFDGAHADSSLSASTLDAVDNGAFLAPLPRLEFSHAVAATRTVVTQKSHMPGA